MRLPRAGQSKPRMTALRRTSLEGVPQRCRSGAGLRIWVSAGARGWPSLAMANGTLMAQ